MKDTLDAEQGRAGRGVAQPNEHRLRGHDAPRGTAGRVGRDRQIGVRPHRTGSVSQWVLACAEDVTGGSFGADRDALSHGTPDRKEESTENASEVDVVTTRLHLGEQAAQRVVLAPGHTSQVHVDTLDEAALGTLVHDVLSQVRHAGDWPQIRARFEARWTLSAEDRATVLTWADRVFTHDASAAFLAEPRWNVNPNGWTTTAPFAPTVWSKPPPDGTSGFQDRGGERGEACQSSAALHGRACCLRKHGSTRLDLVLEPRRLVEVP